MVATIDGNGLGPVTITPLDHHTVRLDLMMPHPSATSAHRSWHLSAEVRRGMNGYPAWKGSAIGGRYRQERAINPNGELLRDLTKPRSRRVWGPTIDRLNREILPLVLIWMEEHGEEMLVAEVANLRQQVAVNRVEAEKALDKYGTLQRKHLDLLRKINDLTMTDQGGDYPALVYHQETT